LPKVIEKKEFLEARRSGKRLTDADGNYIKMSRDSDEEKRPGQSTEEKQATAIQQISEILSRGLDQQAVTDKGVTSAIMALDLALKETSEANRAIIREIVSSLRPVKPYRKATLTAKRIERDFSGRMLGFKAEVVWE